MENYMQTNADDYAAFSRRFVRQAQEEFDKGDQLQASEKAWGAAAHAVKAVAASRGWNHNSHRLLFDIVDQMARDLGSYLHCAHSSRWRTLCIRTSMRTGNRTDWCKMASRR